ncbi:MULTISPECIES: DUF1444 domain-containing protein [Halobacillus]|uniref:UPF0354 protein DXT76_17650 n=2 Tax=Halobacillus TaxID=45667 RepID=A0A3E0J5I9_9BACI|nr:MULTISPECIES: DUF1444 domain-containing protein [Halobacillus]RDY68510.1 DUF1444 domain-containing protein [Halobacillus trueperi]REJ08258.1 DUF1444 domain-containing protein [Halobacillus trueperi]SDN74671.1 Uncharacterized protein YtpQ, UPF0354 family [Halobacillus aidingensis]
MKMTSIKMKKKLEERLANDQWKTTFNRDKDTFRVEWNNTGKGITITLPNVISKYEARGEEAIDELEDHVKEALRVMNEDHKLTGKEQHIFPVIRAGSFPTETEQGKKLIYVDHTAETRIYYALDLGKSYQLIDEKMLEDEGWSLDRIKEVAGFNVRSLPVEMKKDSVYGNDFYFHSARDGYDASRILNEALLEKLKAECKGELAISIPHQDVIIFADVQNSEGYDILAQMAMKFFAEGTVPVTSLSFLYEDKQLEPIFILAQKKPNKDRKEE